MLTKHGWRGVRKEFLRVRIDFLGRLVGGGRSGSLIERRARLVALVGKKEADDASLVRLTLFELWVSEISICLNFFITLKKENLLL
jgi:hypothetical protein